MALINEENNYIKLENNGDFAFYSSQEQREKEKQATSSETILGKYVEVLAEIDGRLMALYETTTEGSDTTEIDNVTEEYTQWNNEYNDYQDDLHIKKGSQHNFHLMAQYFSDIKDSIPNITFSGSALILAQTSVEESYDKAKETKVFGKTTDC